MSNMTKCYYYTNSKCINCKRFETPNELTHGVFYIRRPRHDQHGNCEMMVRKA